ISRANTTGASTKTFFTHWWGRTVRTTPRSRHHSGPPVGGGTTASSWDSGVDEGGPSSSAVSEAGSLRGDASVSGDMSERKVLKTAVKSQPLARTPGQEAGRALAGRASRSWDEQDETSRGRA